VSSPAWTRPLGALLVAAASAAGQEPPPAPAFEPAEVVQRSCALLAELQEGAGRREWPYEGVYRVREEGADEPVIPLGYRVGGTAIACLALAAAPGYAEEGGAERRAAVARGVEFVLEALEHPLLAPERVDGYDVRGWGFVYALLLLVTLEARGQVPADAVEASARRSRAWSRPWRRPPSRARAAGTTRGAARRRRS
jgi:hypothetical protein